MKTSSYSKLALTLACALSTNAALVSTASADSVTYLTSTPITTTTTDWTGTLAFLQFDPSLGALNSVTLAFSSTLSTILNLQNTAGSSSNGTAKTELQVTVQDAGLNLTNPVLDLLSPDYTYSLAPGGTDSSGLLIKSGSSNDLYTLPAILAEFTGLGNYTLAASTFTQTLLANTGGNTSAGQASTAGLTGAVTYNYTAAPEPSAALLMLSSIGMLAGFKRFGRRNRA